MPDATITQNDVDKIWDYERMMSLKPLLFKDVMEIQPTYLIYPMENTTIDSPEENVQFWRNVVDNARIEMNQYVLGKMDALQPQQRTANQAFMFHREILNIWCERKCMIANCPNRNEQGVCDGFCLRGK